MTNPYESYYISKQSDLTGKMRKLLKKSVGWRREVLDALLLEEKDEVTADAISHILSTVMTTPVNDNKRGSFFIGLLPKNIQGKANLLMHYVNKVVQVTEEGIVQYDDGSYGSNIIDLLKYFCSSRNFRVKKPFDADKLEKLLKEAGAPLSAFGKTVDHLLVRWKNRSD